MATNYSSKEFSLDQLESAFNAIAISAAAPKKANKLGYVKIPGQTVLSFSKLTTLYTCPREFQLKELQERTSRFSTLDTSFGHSLAAGIQALWKYSCIEIATLELIRAWDFDFFEDIWGKKKFKSIYYAIEALQNYYNFIYVLECETWQYAELDLKSDELLFFIQVDQTYNFQGHIDLILQNKHNLSLKVVEIKTKGYGHIAAHWQNSMQTKGYFAVLALLGKRLGIPTSPEVTYLCYAATSSCRELESNFGFSTFHFYQAAQGSDFALNLIQDSQLISMYAEDSHFPMRGGSFVSYNCPCYFFGFCNDPLGIVALPEGTYEALSLEDCDIITDLAEIVESFSTIIPTIQLEEI